jgi:hypothetical protein
MAPSTLHTLTDLIPIIILIIIKYNKNLLPGGGEGEG